jgi:hypothetical protein
MYQRSAASIESDVRVAARYPGSTNVAAHSGKSVTSRGKPDAI